MAMGSQGQGHGDQRRDRNNGGSRPQGQSAGQGRAQGWSQGQGVEEAGRRLREGYDTAREEMGRRYRWAEGTVARNPAPSIFIGFGVGFGIGLALASMLTQREETWADRYLPETFRDLPDSLRKKAPGSVRDFHWSDAYDRLCEAVQGLPAAINKMAHSR